MSKNDKRRFAIVGTGGRSSNFTHPIFERFNTEAELVALCDSSEVRMRHCLKELRDKTGAPDLPLYKAADFQRMLDELEQNERSAQQALTTAEAERELATATLRRAEAQLLGPGSQMVPNGTGGDCCVQIMAPRSGIVLDIPDRNARQVAAGTPLLTVGDIEDLEIEIDLLSGDAVRVPQAAPARVERWGGDTVLEARVRRIDPAAFTRVSALGIEEQRVHVLLDLLSPPEDRPGLGDQFRVLVRIVVWQDDDLLQVPQSALFRQGEGWAVFRAVDGLAVLTPVTPGRQADTRTEITQGLDEGDQVILYPASALSDGARIVSRDD